MRLLCHCACILKCLQKFKHASCVLAASGASALADIVPLRRSAIRRRLLNYTAKKELSLDDVVFGEAKFTNYSAVAPIMKCVLTFLICTLSILVYVLTVYFGSVGIIRYRYALTVGLTTDIAGLIACIFIINLVFG